MLGELAERRDLAAEYAEQRRAAERIEVEDIIARHSRTLRLEFRPVTRLMTSLPQGPPPFTNGRARTPRLPPLRASVISIRHSAPSRRAEAQAVRVSTSAPRSAASMAFSTTSRASST